MKKKRNKPYKPSILTPLSKNSALYSKHLQLPPERAELIIWPLKNFIEMLKRDEVMYDDTGDIVMYKKGKEGSTDPTDYFKALAAIGNTAMICYFMSFFHVKSVEELNKFAALIDRLEFQFTSKIEKDQLVKQSGLEVAEKMCELMEEVIAKSTYWQFEKAREAKEKVVDAGKSLEAGVDFMIGAVKAYQQCGVAKRSVILSRALI